MLEKNVKRSSITGVFAIGLIRYYGNFFPFQTGNTALSYCAPSPFGGLVAQEGGIT
jgi:hypothetical protein